MTLHTTSPFRTLDYKNLTPNEAAAQYCLAQLRTKEGRVPGWRELVETTGGQVAFTSCHLPKGHDGRHEATTSW